MILEMKRSGDRFLWAAVIFGTLLGACILGAALWHWSLFFRRNAIRELPELPVHSIAHLVGVVTYTDGPGDRFWIEDETGSTVVLANPDEVGVHVGETVSLDATKTSRYDPNQGPISLGLSEVTVRASSAHVKLPQPFPAILTKIPGPEKNGTRIQVTGILEKADLDLGGRAWLSITDAGSWIEVTVARPDRDYSKLINATVRIAGLTEQVRNSQGSVIFKLMWVPSGSGLQMEQPAPKTSPLYSLRDLYREMGNVSGHSIRIRGRVAASDPDSILLEDRWGSILCRVDRAQQFPAGTAIDVTGFPHLDGMRFELSHAQAVQIPSGQVDRSDPGNTHLSPITTVAAVRALSASDAAQALPLRIDGVITYIDPLWRQVFVQDRTGGIFIKYSGAQQDLKQGLRVIVIGMTNPGNFAPVVVAPSLQVEGPAPLPVPVSVTSEDAATGLLDSNYVTVEGVVHPIKFAEQTSHPILTFELYTSIGQIHVYTDPGFPDLRQSRHLEDAKVRISGVLGTIFNSRRQLVGYQLMVASPSQIEVIEPGVRDPFSMETTPIGALLRFSPGSHFGHRVKVAGSVTMVGSDFFYLQDASGGVELRGGARTVHAGERIEAIGYPALAGRYSPVISDVEFRPVQGSGIIAPKLTSAEAILQGEYDSQLVTVEGRLLAASTEPGNFNLILQSGVRTFTAQLDTSDMGAYPFKLQEGSMIRLTGVASAQIDPDKVYMLLQDDTISFKILLRSPEDILVVGAARFWTPQTTLALLTLSTLCMVAILVWVGVLRKRVHSQDAALQKASQTAQAIRDLSAAMQEVSSEERFDAQVSVRGSEDIAQLVVGFNQMLSQLLQRDRAKRSAEEKLKHQALVDELTGLPNRRLLSDRLSQSLAVARRENRTVGLLYIDLDGFKLVNDSLGHAAGDLLLVEVGKRLKSRTRKSDTLARIGGDEFTVILNHLETREDAEKMADSLLHSLVSPFLIEGHEITIGASIGISIFPDQGSDNDDLLQQADSAMYAAKRSGKNRIFHFSNDLGVSVRERLTLENELRRALANKEICVHYQPEFDLATNSVIRFEALARWTHSNLGVISPASFIPVAEECGLIVPLGTHILELACREALTWQEISDRPVQVAVNVSSVQFARESFVRDIVEVLDRTGLHPSLLQLELTESSTLIGIQRAAATMRKLKSIGIGIAMDDFGSGYSCLSYLPKLPFDELKIDRSFVSELMVSLETRALVQSILTLAHNLGMKVVVEGIETPEQLALIRELGGDEAQGFFLGRPGPDPSGRLRKQRRSMKHAHTGKLEPVV
jgi:diguanylate cyclase (GGDEF)-like protein